MMFAFETVPDRRHEIAAGIPPYDRTCRAQILEPEASPDDGCVLERFRERTGIGADLNTSVNLHGEPSVSSPDNPLRTLLNCELALLTIDDHLVSKPVVT